MAAGVFTFLSILLYIHKSTGQNYCGDDRFFCWADFTCLPLSYKCDGYEDCSSGSDERGCGDGDTRKCHCKYKPECSLSLFCEMYGCKKGWQGYRCATKIGEKTVTTFSQTITQSYDCHCVDQSMCQDSFYSRSCTCQEGWKGTRCSEKITYITDESLGLIGGVIIVLLIVSVVGLMAFCISRVKRRRGLWVRGLPYRGLSNFQDSEERSSVSAIPPHLSSAPPSYEDVVNRGTGYNPGQISIHIPDRNQVETSANYEQEVAPPSYESIIKNQEIQLHSHENSTSQTLEPIQENTASQALEPIQENTASQALEPIQENTTSQAVEPIQENTASQALEPIQENTEPGCGLVFQTVSEPMSDSDLHDVPAFSNDRELIIPIQ